MKAQHSVLFVSFRHPSFSAVKNYSVLLWNVTVGFLYVVVELQNIFYCCQQYERTCSWTLSGLLLPSDNSASVNNNLLSYLLTPWCRVLLEKLTGLQLVKKFPAFHGTRRFITALTSVRHLSLSWASPIQSIYPHPTSWRSILILSTHLRLGLPSGLFPSGFPTKTLYTPLSSPIRATCPTHLILLDFITRTLLGEEYKSFSSSLCSLLHSPVTIIIIIIIIIIVIFHNNVIFVGV